MTLGGELVLPADVLVIPADDVPAETRERLGIDPTQFALTRPNARSASKVIDADAARLLDEFREATSVVDAVVRYADAAGREPREVLREAFPLVRSLAKARFLVPPAEAGRIEPSLAAGDVFEGLTVARVIQTLDDTEVFQVRASGGATAALKVARRDDRRIRTEYEREAAVLDHLDGDPAPRLVASGESGGRPYVAAEWRTGIDPFTAAAEARQRGDRRALLRVALAVAEAYATLHERGVVHGDVHPRNVIIDRGGRASLVDFGLARWKGLRRGLARPERGGIAWYADPDYAAARRTGRVPPADEASEQYSLCALLYHVLAGERYLDFSVEREVLYRQILEEEPLPFVRHGLEPWPDVEAVLRVGLSKDRARRFGSVRELADRLGEIGDAATRTDAEAVGLPAGPRHVLERVLQRIAPAGAIWPPDGWEGPTASVNYGAAGIGYMLYRLALLREDPALLADADTWTARARRDADAGSRAFYYDGFGIPPRVAAGVSLYHAPAGVACVEALVAQALGDMPSHARAIETFVAACAAPCAQVDLTLGRGGALLGAALLLESMAWPEKRTSGALSELVAGELAGLWDQLDSYPPLPTARELPFLGIAHGWGGVLYATLRACRVAALPLPAGAGRRLDELADAAEPVGRGLRWRRKVVRRADDADYMPGWCNGSAGLVSLWLLAGRHTGDSRYTTLAEGAAWNAWEAGDTMANLCCGLTGRAYAQLALYRHTGEREWLERAAALAERAAAGIGAPTGVVRTSLYKGDLAVGLLAADLERPDRSCFPMFEDEGWPSARA